MIRGRSPATARYNPYPSNAKVFPAVTLPLLSLSATPPKPGARLDLPPLAGSADAFRQYSGCGQLLTVVAAARSTRSAQ
jgi:hypothetical protein